jgi:hypothetical protein
MTNDHEREGEHEHGHDHDHDHGHEHDDEHFGGRGMRGARGDRWGGGHVAGVAAGVCHAVPSGRPFSWPCVTSRATGTR